MHHVVYISHSTILFLHFTTGHKSEESECNDRVSLNAAIEKIFRHTKSCMGAVDTLYYSTNTKYTDLWIDIKLYSRLSSSMSGFIAVFTEMTTGRFRKYLTLNRC